MPSTPPVPVIAAPAFWRVAAARAESAPDARAFVFLGDGETEADRLTWSGLDRRARAVAVRLRRELGEDAVGSRALLLLPPGLDFVTAFLGCVYAGVVAVPAYPPRPVRLKRGRGGRPGDERLRALLADARPRAALVTSRSAGFLAGVPGFAASGAAALAVDEILDDGGDAEARRWRPPPEDPDAVAFLQYTSGSTATPRGVEVTHANLSANQRAIQAAFDQSEESVVVGWLPLYHDMGLVGTVLQPIHCGGFCVLMSPAAFLQRPRRWLEAIDRYRATTSGGPDFGYALTARKVPAEERAGLDLSSWRVAFDGAEPVRAATLDAFADAFAPAGFRRAAFLPCYGLAEATLFVSGTAADREPAVVEVSAKALERGQAKRPLGTDEESHRLVSCGRPGPETEVAVVDPERRARLPPGRVGEVWVAGPGVARGYFRRPDESGETFGARLADWRIEERWLRTGRNMTWLRTGDLGFLGPGGELFVTGRRKDLLVLRGRNLYPHDLERTAEAAHPALRPGGAAAFSIDRDGEERLALAREIDRRREGEAAEALAAARAAVIVEHDVAVTEVVALRAGDLPRTSSGKVRRSECRRRFESGEMTGLLENEEREPARRAEVDPIDPAGDLPGFLLAAARELGAPVDGDPEAPLLLDSLQAMELRNKVTAALGVEPPVAPFLEGASATELARAVEGLERSPAVAVAPAPDGPPTVTAGQRAFLLLERLGASAPGRATSPYSVAFAARIHRSDGGAPSPEALARALETLVARHPALRTVYPEPGGGGEPTARVLDPGPDTLDLEVVDAPGDDEALRRLLASELERPFDLAHLDRGPLVRARLLRTGRGDRPILLLAIHHIAVDLWSLEILLAELAALLAPSQDPGGSLDAEPPSFAAFARHQADRLRERGSALREHWRSELAGAPTVLELPADRPRPAVASAAGERLPFDLPAEAVTGARLLAREAGTTLFPVLLAAWATLLGRLAGRDEVLIGTPAAGRTRPGFEGTVGYFANLLPIRVDLAGEGGFAGRVERLRGRIARALDHQELPFPEIVDAAAPARDRSRHPLVQAGLVLERPHRLRGAEGEAADFVLGRDGARVGLDGIALEAVGLPYRAVQMDLMLVAAEAGDRLTTALDLATDLFDRTTAARWAGSLGVLLAAAARDPDRPLHDLPLLTETERRELLETRAEGPRKDPDRWERSVPELVAERAEAMPDGVAVESPVGAITYGALVRSARRLAALLRRLGVGPERAVAVDLDRSPELIVVLLAVLEAGGYYVPLDRSYPRPRLRAMVEATRPAVIVSNGAPCVAVPVIGSDASVLDLAEIDLQALPDRPLEPARTTPDALAYAVFTSGSTGEPKGIGAPHRAVARLIDDPGFHPLGPGDTLLQLAPVSFDASTFEIWGVLAAGARLVVTPPGPVAAGPLGETLERHRVTAAWLTSGLFHLAVDAGPERAFGPMRWIATGGDATSTGKVRRALGAGRPGRDVTVFYGPTEGTTFASWNPFRAGEGEGADPEIVPLGAPVAGTRLFVTDARLRPAPTGVPGELLLGGSGLARGYLGRPALTAERFVPDPFTTPNRPDRSDGRLYRTGDLVRREADGRLTFLGRIDTQVKVRGFRVELGEVEGALRRCPGVAEAAVVRRGDALAGFVTVREPAPTEEEIRRHAAGELPSFMTPATLTILDALPLGSTGKVDRRALSDRSERPAAAPASAARRPASERERELARLFARALDLPPERADGLDPEASFFDLGGHSLGLARLHGLLTSERGVEIPIADLFDHPSIAALARRLDGGDSRAGSTPDPAPDGSADARAARRSAAMRRRLDRRSARRSDRSEETE